MKFFINIIDYMDGILLEIVNVASRRNDNELALAVDRTEFAA